MACHLINNFHIIINIKTNRNMRTKTKTFLFIIFMISYFQGSAQQTIEDNKICMDPISGRGVYLGTGSGGAGVCLLCGVVGASNVIDADQSNYVVASLPVSLLSGTPIIAIKDSLQYYPAGNEAGFIVGPNGGLLSASILSNLQVQTFRNGILQESGAFSGGGSLLNLSVLQGVSGGKQILSLVTTKDFDEIRLVSVGVVGALTSLRVYGAFEGPTTCPKDCVNALTGTEVTGNPSTGSSGICVGGGVTDANNVIGDTTAAANLAVPLLGVACSRYLEVSTTATYPIGTYAGFAVSDNSGLLGLNLLDGLTVETYLGSTLQESVSGSSLLSALALNGSSPVYQVGFKTTKTFNKIRIVAQGLVSLGLAASYDVYYAYVKLDTDLDGIPDCMDRCTGNDLIDTDGDGYPDACDSNTIDISVAKTVSNSAPTMGSNVNFTITATRDAATLNATGLQIKDLLPSGLTYVSHTAPTGTFYIPLSGIWNVGSALGGTTTSLSLAITAKVDSVGILTNFAEIIAANETDTDSPYNNGSTTEDDVASVCVSVPIQICLGDSIKLTSSTVAPTYQWYKDDVAIVGATNADLIVGASGNYTVNFTSTAGCLSGNCCPITVNVNALPVISAGVDRITCSGTAVALTATGTGTFLWNTGETTSSISVSPTTTTTYIVSLTNAAGCVNYDTVVVNVNPSILSANAVTYCNDAGTTSSATDDTFDIVLNPSGGSGTTYTVTVDGVSTGATYTYGGASPFINAGLISTGSKTIIITDANGCTLTTSVAPPANCSSCPTKICVPITITLIRK